MSITMKMMKIKKVTLIKTKKIFSKNLAEVKLILQISIVFWTHTDPEDKIFENESILMTRPSVSMERNDGVHGCETKK